MQKIIFTLLSLILCFCTASANTNSETIVIGNGSMSVEATTSGKFHLTVGYKNIFNTFNIAFPDAQIEKIEENKDNGEIITTAVTGKSHFTQKVITSQSDNAIIILLTAEDNPFTQKIKLTAASGKKKHDISARTTFTAKDKTVEIRSAFNKPLTIEESQLYGYETALRVINDNGKIENSGEEIVLSKCRSAIIYITSKAMPTLANTHFAELNQHIDAISSLANPNPTKPNAVLAYNNLQQRHLEKFTAICKEVAFTLHTDNNTDKEMTNIYNQFYYNSLRRGETPIIETENFGVLPKLTPLLKAQITASFLFDKYLYTLDADFLEQKVLPQMLTTYEALEKTLNATDDFGFYIISKNDPTFEVAVTIFFVRDFITTCNILMAHQEKVARLQEILAKLPPYKIDINEEFRRHLFGESANENKYSDVPQLYGLFYRNDPIITRNYDIRQACKTTIETCIKYRNDNEIKGIDSGFQQLALSSAALGDGETTYKLLNAASTSLTKTNSKTLVPIIKKMLAQSYYSPESSKCYLNLLPAIPDLWTEGELAGMPVRGGITIKDLIWDSNGDADATIEATTDITAEVYFRGHFITTLQLTKDNPHILHIKKK